MYPCLTVHFWFHSPHTDAFFILTHCVFWRIVFHFAVMAFGDPSKFSWYLFLCNFVFVLVFCTGGEYFGFNRLSNQPLIHYFPGVISSAGLTFYHERCKNHIFIALKYFYSWYPSLFFGFSFCILVIKIIMETKWIYWTL